MKKLFLTLFVVASLVSCNSDDSDGIAINSSDNKITLDGVKQDFLSDGSYYWTYNALVTAGNTFEGYYRHGLYTEGYIGADYIEIDFDLYTNSATYPTGTLTYSETATGTAIIGNVEVDVYGSNNVDVSYTATAGNVKITKLSGSIHRINMNLTISDGTSEYVLKGIVVDSLIED